MSEPEEIGTEQMEQLEQQVLATIRTIYDPELPVNIHDLGLIYECTVHPDATVYVKMTLTAPNCPAAGFLPGQVEQRIKEIPEVKDALVDLTFDPPYHRDMMTDAAKLELGLL
jgi:FeS assembly SUF system protein